MNQENWKQIVFSKWRHVENRNFSDTELRNRTIKIFIHGRKITDSFHFTCDQIAQCNRL